MKLHLYIALFTVVLGSASVLSQTRGGNEPVLNFSFENWSGNPLDPDGYTTSNTLPFQPVFRAGESTHGSYSLGGKVINFNGGPIPPLATSDEFPVSKRYAFLKGNYRFLPQGADTFQVNVAMKKGSNLVGTGNIQFLNTQSTWREFYVDIEYANLDTPTTCIITINLQDVIYAFNTEFRLDELEFGDPIIFSTRQFIGSNSVPSVQYTDINTLTEAADDFVVPQGESWQLSGVKIYGTFTNGINGFSGAVANIRSDDNNKPGPVVFSDTLDNFNFFFGQNPFIPFRTIASLNPGKYWINCYMRLPINPDSSVFAWATSTANYGSPFHWRDPAMIFDTAVNWTPGNQVVVGGGEHDLLFMLAGYADSVIGIQQIGSQIPSEYSLNQNYPNPFNPSTVIKFNMPKGEFVSLKIYNILGEETASLVNEFLDPGSYQFLWNASELSSGVYFYTLKTEQFASTKKMLLIK
ncbi:MAG: T9SS type A sorting domain-containing protein [Ignavibacteria bacterium]|nr:T9SS type A sorting domain-containing protein [Ignavibacteria bacterium]